MNITHSNRVRKDLKTLSLAQHRQYFFLLRVLKICEPLPEEKKAISRPFGYFVTPRSLYDNLNSMHNTCCEHGTSLFPYWHRYVFQVFEEFLIRCHYYLLSLKDQNNIKSQASRLRQIAFQNGLSPILSLIGFQNLLRNVFQSYNNILKSFPQNIIDKSQVIAAHYWNPMDGYKKGVYYPKGFYREKQQNGGYKYVNGDEYFGEIDMLVQAIYDELGIFEYNQKTRKTGSNKIEINIISKDQMNKQLGGLNNAQTSNYNQNIKKQ